MLNTKAKNSPSSVIAVSPWQVYLILGHLIIPGWISICRESI
jgi:hypothetical protein